MAGKPRDPGAYEVQKKQFLKSYKKLGVKGKAANAAGVTPRTIQVWEKADPKFRADVLAITAEIVEELEENLLALARNVPLQLAIAGQKGFSSAALHAGMTTSFFLLKAHKPEAYRDTYKWGPKRQQETDLTAEEMTKLEQALGASGGAVEAEPEMVHGLGDGPNSGEASSGMA